MIVDLAELEGIARGEFADIVMDVYRIDAKFRILKQARFTEEKFRNRGVTAPSIAVWGNRFGNNPDPESPSNRPAGWRGCQ